MYSVYIHTNKINGKKYCGITNNIEYRWRLNGIAYKPPKNANKNSRRFWNAICKYGFDNFSHDILYENQSFEQACELEKSIISDLKLQDPRYGYNIAPGGNGGKVYLQHPKGMLGKHHSDIHNKNHSEFMRQQDKNCMTNGSCIWGITHEHPKGMLGKHHSEEKKKQVSKQFSKPIVMVDCYGNITKFENITRLVKAVGINFNLVSRLAKDKVIYCGDKFHPKTKLFIGYKFAFI